MLVIYFYAKLAEKKKTGKFSDEKKLNRGLILSFSLLLAITASFYCRLDYFGIIRDNAVNEALKNDYSPVEILEYPKNAEHIQWASNFIEKETYIERYKLFKSIPEDKEIEIVYKD